MNRYLFILALLLIVSGCKKSNISPDNDPTIIDFSSCVTGSSESTFEIVTFNVAGFPKNGLETIGVVANLISEMDVDIIALQEVASKSYFEELDNLLTQYSGIFYPIDNDLWNLAFLYKESEITIDNLQSKIIFESDFSAFPRPPFEIAVSHSSTGLNMIIINNHLKCCGGADNEDRRRDASNKLHTYVMETYPNNPVIILGDLNDIIDGQTEEDNVFWSFVNDPDNFKFSDTLIASGPSEWWSYPSWPSHIDHIIVTNELFSRVDTSSVFRPDLCFPNYPYTISDHRPVYTIFR
jgi:endonuclease/exonuclease/phosphatase family metal-dependent hydrolase